MSTADGIPAAASEHPCVVIIAAAPDPRFATATELLRRDAIAVRSLTVEQASEDGLERRPPHCLVVDLRTDPAARDLLVWYTRTVARAVLTVTAPPDVRGRLHALAAGVADHLVAPFAPEEAVARVKAILERRRESDASEFVFGDVVVDPKRQIAVVDGAATPLSAREMAVLLMLIRHRSRVVSKKELLEEIWRDKRPTPNMVEATISSLRRKFGHRGASLIHTVHGAGYIFQAPVSGPTSRATLLADRDRLLRQRDELLARPALSD